ncbi:hypothetical protein ASG31_15400 [Chryseobacterium sp. Leaf404]|uniref:DUF2975 domain-containing protein n=1 Tax=unclassified Chryseobacterium TaxID=2593645 RepID=UPI0006F8B9D7|nr:MULTISPECIES: DUF2975 domain-containing protein [unclassified Chryseobacterium]KQT15311.1 hypothetical protein ASG31_15400 [Chryseobacterium sp. Leaf404]
MKLLGKNSLLYWLKYPFGIYTLGFTLISIWILGLMSVYAFTSSTNQFISLDNWKTENNIQQISSEIVQFHYPFTKMVLVTENSLEGVSLAFLGLASLCFILIIIFKILNELSKDNFFTENALNSFKILGFGLIVFGSIHLAIDLLTSSQRFDLTPPFLFIITGLIFIFLKEIFAKGRKIQEENDLTI